MGRINNKVTYPQDSNPSIADYLIGTDSVTLQTKTFSIESIAEAISYEYTPSVASQEIRTHAVVLTQPDLVNGAVKSITLPEGFPSGKLFNIVSVRFLVAVISSPSSYGGTFDFTIKMKDSTGTKVVDMVNTGSGYTVNSNVNNGYQFHLGDLRPSPLIIPDSNQYVDGTLEVECTGQVTGTGNPLILLIDYNYLTSLN